MIISLIVAVAENNVIGKDNDLPWHLPDDMKYFMETTKGHYVLMGRKNYESIPTKFRPLPHRTNIIITRQQGLAIPDCIVVNNIEDALALASGANQDEAFVIGGAQIFSQVMDKVNRMYITEIHATVEGDVYFPEYDKNEWNEISRKHHDADDRHKHAFDYVVYERKTNR